MRILQHAVAVIRPRGGPFDADIDGDVIRACLGFLDYLPTPTRLAFPLGLRLLEYGPFLFREGLQRFSSMDDATAARYLHHWERAGGAPSMLYQGVRALVLVCFYQHPQILKAMEVDWQGRADERVRYRVRMLREMAAAAQTTAAPSTAAPYASAAAAETSATSPPAPVAASPTPEPASAGLAPEDGQP
jgi:hypothetical protein